MTHCLSSKISSCSLVYIQYGAKLALIRDCCPPVVDPYALTALLAGIALAAYFLRLALVKKKGRRRRDVTINQLTTRLGLGR
jgi:hypothetical protein